MYKKFNTLLDKLDEKISNNKKNPYLGVWLHNGSKEEIQKLSILLEKKYGKIYNIHVKTITSSTSLETLTDEIKNKQQQDFFICLDYLSEIKGHRQIPSDYENKFCKINLNYEIVF